MDKSVRHAAAPAAERVARTTSLRREIFSPNLAFVMEAHNGLSAKIAEESEAARHSPPTVIRTRVAARA